MKARFRELVADLCEECGRIGNRIHGGHEWFERHICLSAKAAGRITRRGRAVATHLWRTNLESNIRLAKNLWSLARELSYERLAGPDFRAIALLSRLIGFELEI